jgi:hypothetical protein
LTSIVLPLQAIKSVLVRVTEPDWKWDIQLGYKALSLNGNDEAFRLDVHLGKMDVPRRIKDFRFSGPSQGMKNSAHFEGFQSGNPIMETKSETVSAAPCKTPKSSRLHIRMAQA